VNYEFNEGLIAISANIAFGVNDSTKRTTKLNEFLFRTFPWKIAKVKNFGWSLCVSELVIVAWWCWHLSSDLPSLIADFDSDDRLNLVISTKG